jgi:hypothetical protein
MYKLDRARQRLNRGQFGVYVAQLNEQGPIRVGFSRDIPMRIKRIQADCPSGEIRLILSRSALRMPDGLQGTLKPYAHPYGKDWYRCCAEVIQAVKDL